MTLYDLQRGNKLVEEIKELQENITLLKRALDPTVGRRKFFFSCREKNKIHIDSISVSFAGELKVDRECMELIQKYFENKFVEAEEEFKSLGKDN